MSIRYGLTSKESNMPTLVFRLERDAILFAQRFKEKNPAKDFEIQKLFIAPKGKSIKINL